MGKMGVRTHMRSTKKIFTYIAIIMLIFALTACDITSGQFPPPETHRFYPTIGEAIFASEGFFRVNYPGGLPTTGEITRLIKNDGNAFFIIINPEGRPAGVIDIFIFYTKVDGYGNTMFSRIVSPRWIYFNLHMRRYGIFEMTEIGEIRYGIHMYRWPNNWWVSTRVGEHISQRPAWGISQTERVHNLRVDGQEVTEVIELEFNGERIFFWYFEDLKTDRVAIFYVDDPELWDVNAGEMEICLG